MRDHILGIAGKQKSGKSTLAAALARVYPVERTAFAAPLKRWADELWPGLSKDAKRPYLQGFGQGLRELDPDAWVNYWRRGVEASDFFGRERAPVLIIVDDVRFPNEAQAVKDLGGLLLRLNVTPAQQLARGANPATLDDATERALDGYAGWAAWYAAGLAPALVATWAAERIAATWADLPPLTTRSCNEVAQ